MSDNSQLELIREAANRPPYKQDVYVNAGQLLAEIEREYLELPILESEPLKVGDKVDGYNQNGAEVVAVMNSKMVVVRSTVKGGNGYHDEAYPLLLWSVDDLKRPEPEVLDADGVPIKVGDVVRFVGGAERFDVLGIESDGDWGAHIGRKDCTSTDAWAAPSDLTHKQPDSLERIEEEAHMKSGEYCMKYDLDCLISECDKAMRLHLLHRQREVLERGQ